jgi:hypothetical protein
MDGNSGMKAFFRPAGRDFSKKIIADSVTTMENTSCAIPIFAA